MKAALRVLTALSDRQQPDPGDLDELHWYAPSDRERPIDELVCDALQQALKDREQKRKAIQVQLRERALASSPVGYESEPAARKSQERQDREIGRLAREHGQRRQEYQALDDKLKRVGVVLQQATEKILAAGPDDSANSEAARTLLESVAGEVDLRGITELLSEHARLTKRLHIEEQALKDHGVE